MYCKFHLYYSWLSFSIICIFHGNREGITDLPCSTLVSVDAQCSIALLFNFIYIVMSFGIMHLTLFFINVNLLQETCVCVDRKDATLHSLQYYTLLKFRTLITALAYQLMRLLFIHCGSNWPKKLFALELMYLFRASAIQDRQYTRHVVHRLGE